MASDDRPRRGRCLSTCASFDAKHVQGLQQSDAVEVSMVGSLLRMSRCAKRCAHGMIPPPPALTRAGHLDGGVRVRNGGVGRVDSLLGLPLNQLRVLVDVADDLKIIPMR
jgi:hypothetical protein